MVARSLVAQRSIDQDKVWGWSDRGDLSGGRDADEQPTAGRKKLFGHEYRERRAYGTADDADLAKAVKFGGEQLGMIAGPSFMDLAGVRPLEVTGDITVWIEHADFGDSDERQLPLPARLP
nr:hypothetical protein [Bradyrhizobium cenepequi]